MLETSKIIESDREETEKSRQSHKRYKEDQIVILKLKILTLKYKNSMAKLRVKKK